jgi:ribosomal protein L37E
MATAICKRCGHRQTYKAQGGPRLKTVVCDECGKPALRRYLNKDWEADLEAKYGPERRRRELRVVEHKAQLGAVDAAQVESFADERPPVMVAASAKRRRPPQALTRLKKKLDQVSRSLVALQTNLINSDGAAQKRQAEALEALAAFAKQHAEQSSKLGAAVLAKLDAIEVVLVHQLAEAQSATDDAETAPAVRSPLDVLRQRAFKGLGDALPSTPPADELPPVEDNPADAVKRRDPYLDPWAGLRIATDACTLEVLGVVSGALTVRKTYDNGAGDELAMTREQWETLRRAPGARVLDAADEEVQFE